MLEVSDATITQLAGQWKELLRHVISWISCFLNVFHYFFASIVMHACITGWLVQHLLLLQLKAIIFDNLKFPMVVSVSTSTIHVISVGLHFKYISYAHELLLRYKVQRWYYALDGSGIFMPSVQIAWLKKVVINLLYL